MGNFEEIAALIADSWGRKTLQDFRFEAEREATGICFESVRVQDGPRIVLIVCVTEAEQVARLAAGLRLGDASTEEDWRTRTLAEVLRLAFVEGRLAFDSLHDEFGRRVAVILSAADPRSITSVERLFKLTP